MDKKRRKRTVITRPSHDSCRTCRFRKVKCDAARPVCRRCLDAGRACGGYTSWVVDLGSRGSVSASGLHSGALREADGSPFESVAEEVGLRVKDEFEEGDEFVFADDGAFHYSPPAQPDPKRTWSLPIRTEEKWKDSKALIRHSSLPHITQSDHQKVYVMDYSIVRDQQIFAIFAQANSAWAVSGGHEPVLAMIAEDHLSSSLVPKTLRALSWAYASSVDHKNKQILHAAQESYGEAMVAVSSRLHALQSGKQCGETPLAMLTSIQMLGLYQDSAQRFSSRPLSPNWHIHIRGAQEYVKSCGLKAQGWGEHLVAIWFMGYSVDLAKRRAGPLSLRDWYNCPVLRISGGVPVHSWFPIALPLPGLLQAVDRILALPATKPSSTAQKKLINLVSQLDRVRNDMTSWIAQNVPFHSITITLRHLDPKLEEHHLLSTNYTFPTQYEYADPNAKTHFKMYAVYSQLIALISTTAILRLQHHFSPHVTTIFLFDQVLEGRNLESSAFTTACTLCQDVYSLSMTKSVLYALLLRTAIEAAAAFFQDYGAAERELEFCLQCRDATDKRLGRLREDHARTLCRIVDVAPLLVGSARYR